MLEAAKNLRDEERLKEQSTASIQTRIEKRKTKLINNFIKKPKAD